MGRQALRASFLSGQNAGFIGGLWRSYRQNPLALDSSWQEFFASLDSEEQEALDDFVGPSWQPKKQPHGHLTDGEAFMLEAAQTAVDSKKTGKDAAPPLDRKAVQDSIRAMMLIRAYRVRGHLLADIDPLGMQEREKHPELDPSTYGFGPADWDHPIDIDHVLGLDRPSLRQIMERLRKTYCGRIAVQFTHIQDPEQKAWLQERMENAENHTDFTDVGKKAILAALNRAESFEKFLHMKYIGTKRFGLDGGESLVPGIEQILKRGGQLGLEEVVIGMAHRGRLNILANVMEKPFVAIFSEFQGNPAHPDDVQGSGDVKYHLGTSTDRDFDGNNIHLSLTANPSHLEAVNPVVLGKVRAKQMQRADKDRVKVMPLLFHGDAAFAGQGVVAETLSFYDLKGYRVGGTMHVVINNQIGFTTDPNYSRSGPYCTDVALAVQAPIFHVNGDDPESVVHVCRIATEFRQKFHTDVVVDLVCYRRFGHNESDEPAFTQPLMYEAIKNHTPVAELYAQQLVREGLLSAEEVTQMREDFMAHLQEEFEAAENYRSSKADWLDGAWSGLSVASGEDRRGTTGVDRDLLKKLGEALTSYPEGFQLNSKIARLFKTKKKMFETGQGIDWATAEALAFGSLVCEGYPVRLSGQDSGRGTFSQRHSVLVDQKTGDRYVPLNNINSEQSKFEVHDSPLSEFGVLGFEYGFSSAEPRALVLWEAQFGDFANGAQIMFDQFISSAESKWLRMSGLVMLLPHGYEGQGPEHSSARLERFLQMSGADNWQVINCTTPANYFHALRRQIWRDFRKPLVVMTPKSLLRHKLCVSSLEEMAAPHSFHRVLADPGEIKSGKGVKRVVLCSGKVFYDLYEARQKAKIDDVALIRVEQLYPFPPRSITEELNKYPQAEICWCQEEPANMGSWWYIERKLRHLLRDIGRTQQDIPYFGRKEAASPATGSAKRHASEQEELVQSALNSKKGSMPEYS